MRDLSPAFQDHLDTGATTLCACIRVDRVDGHSFGFTEHDRDLTVSGFTYKAASALTRSEASSALGLQPGNLDVAGALRSDDLNEDDLARDLFDGAEVTMYRVNWADPTVFTLDGRGKLGETTRTSLGFTAELRSLAAQLGQKTGRTFHYFCDADLGDARCTIDLTDPAFNATGTLSGTPTRTAVTLGAIGSFDAGFFNGGLFTLTSGALDGMKIEIKTHNVESGVHSLVFWQPLPDAPAAGDAFLVTAGCDKAFTTCSAKFANTENFRGFPHMPLNDTLAAYPRKEEPTDGGSLFKG